MSKFQKCSKSYNCETKSPCFDYKPICIKPQLQVIPESKCEKEEKCLPLLPVFAYLYNRLAQNVGDRQDVGFNDYVGVGVKFSNSGIIVPVNGVYKINFTVTATGPFPLYFALFRNGNLLPGSKYGLPSLLQADLDALQDLLQTQIRLNNITEQLTPDLLLTIEQITTTLSTLLQQQLITQDQFNLYVNMANSIQDLANQYNSLNLITSLQDFLALFNNNCVDPSSIALSSGTLITTYASALSILSNLTLMSTQLQQLTIDLLAQGGLTPTSEQLNTVQQVINNDNLLFQLLQGLISRTRSINSSITDPVSRQIIGTTIVELQANDNITLRNLSCYTVTLPELTAPYAPNGINASLELELLVSKQLLQLYNTTFLTIDANELKSQ